MRPRGFADGFENRATISSGTARCYAPRFFRDCPTRRIGSLDADWLAVALARRKSPPTQLFFSCRQVDPPSPGHCRTHTRFQRSKPTRRHVRHRCPDHRPRHRAGEGLQGRRQGAEVLVSALRSARFRRFFFIGDGAAPPRKALPRDARRGARATRVSPVARAPARLRAAPNRTRPRLGRFARARPSRLRRGRRSRDRFSAVSGPRARTARAGRRG